ncbi:hypothetical protein [Rhizobium rhizogenes]|uniref:hypothetical protein n=1 Tax=Rhizobium rhizogenes TaxID=359 RepID=UPI0024BDB99E|nr:hypothetical protein [Rhizobium rhizogenes]MDJ1632531.1 hypothetical protein [Rhizobium rhizogenes]
MAVVLIILGLLQIGYAALVELSAASAIHEILASVSFGLGCLCLGIAVVIARLDAIKEMGVRNFAQTVSEQTNTAKG